MTGSAEWDAFLTEHGAGEVVAATVTKVMPFGALLEVAPGVHGLLPQADWATEPVTGSTISVRIATIDVDRRRMAFVAA